MNKSKYFDFLIVFYCLLVAKIHFYSKKRPKNTKTLDNVFFWLHLSRGKSKNGGFMAHQWTEKNYVDVLRVFKED